MKRRLAAGLTACMIAGGLVVGLPDANAAITSVTYTCAGVNNDVAATDIFGNNPVTSAQLLSNLAGTIPNFTATPSISILVSSNTLSGNTPTVVAPGATFPAWFNFKADLPSSLVSAAATFGLSQITVTNASFNVNVSGGTPSTVTGGFASKTIVLATTQSVDQDFSGNVTATAPDGSAVQFKAGSAKLSLALNVQFAFTLIKTVTLTCTPNDVTVHLTAVSGGSTTTTSGPTTTAGPTTTTSTTTTTAAPTTTTTSTTTTTAAPTTTTTSTTTTTAAPTTTTTTTTIPTTPGVDQVNIRISGGYNYTSAANVAGAGYAVGVDQFGINLISGFGTFPGKNGGTASASVSVNRFLWWAFGSVNVNDPGAGINSLDAPLFFAPPPAGSKTAAKVSASWFTFNDGFKSYTIDATFSDNG